MIDTKKGQPYLLWILFLILIALIVWFIKKILGGSWSTEEIVVELLIFNTGAIFTLHLTTILAMTSIKADLSHLKMQFRALATDFKYHLQKKE